MAERTKQWRCRVNVKCQLRDALVKSDVNKVRNRSAEQARRYDLLACVTIHMSLVGKASRKSVFDSNLTTKKEASWRGPATTVKSSP